LVLVANRLYLVVMRWDVRNLVQILRAHLTDVQIDHVVIVSVDLVQLVTVQRISFDPVLHVHVLVRENH
jgi:hypothetical protein